jgi:ankyrin repeat protein
MKFNNDNMDNVMIAKSLLPTVINELVGKNELEILKKLKNEIKSLNSHDFTKKNPLHIAAINGHKEIAEFLINNCVSLNELDDNKNTPLNYACINKHKDVALLLNIKGGILNMKSEMGDLLCKLAFEGDLDTIKLFHICGANLMTSNFDGRTLAHIAAAEGNLEIVKYLIEETNYNIMVSDRWGYTPHDEANETIRNLISVKFKTKQRINKKFHANLLSKKIKRNEICMKEDVN